jgi:hypothetical protein
VSTDYATIDGKQFPIDLCVLHLANLQAPQNPLPQARTTPLAKAIINRLPRTETLWEIPPSSSIRKEPENAINQKPVVLPLTTTFAIDWEQISDLFPLIIGKFVARRNDRHTALLGFLAGKIFPPSTKLPKDSPDRP